MSTIESLTKKNIISNNNDTIFSINNGYMINMIQTCKLLFGSEQIPITISMLELQVQNIVIEHNNIYYIRIDKFDNFINMIGKLENHQNNYILINYYNIYNYKLNNFNNDLYLWWIGIKDYLDTKNNKNYKIIKDIIGKQLFNGILTEFNNKLWIIKFKSNTSIFVLTFGYENIDMTNYVNIKNCNYKTIIKNMIKEILLSNPDNFIIENLTKVTGSKSFSQLLLYSHKKKNEYNVPVSQLDNIIQYASKKYKQQYIEYFIKNISNEYYKQKEDDLYLNFRGLNKYFLTINEKYLINFEMKEIINEFYTSITEELIDSYKILYEFNLLSVNI
jgi:hypothetical protein